MSEEKKESLVSKIAKARLSFDKIEKSGHNAHFKFDYATLGNVLASTNKALAQQGLTHYATTVSIDKGEKNTPKGPRSYWQAVVEATVTDGEDSISSVAFGLSDDDTDKGLTKAQTQARKYAYFSVLGLPPGDDDDPDGDSDEEISGILNEITKLLTQNNIDNQKAKDIVGFSLRGAEANKLKLALSKIKMFLSENKNTAGGQ